MYYCSDIPTHQMFHQRTLTNKITRVSTHNSAFLQSRKSTLDNVCTIEIRVVPLLFNGSIVHGGVKIPPAPMQFIVLTAHKLILNGAGDLNLQPKAVGLSNCIPFSFSTNFDLMTRECLLV